MFKRDAGNRAAQLECAIPPRGATFIPPHGLKTGGILKGFYGDRARPANPGRLERERRPR